MRQCQCDGRSNVCNMYATCFNIGHRVVSDVRLREPTERVPPHCKSRELRPAKRKTTLVLRETPRNLLAQDRV